jgi:choice-of-anchor B domain-containing protein
MIKFSITLFSVVAFLSGAKGQASLGVNKLGQLTYVEKINDVWGWENQGQEFALVGVENGLSIVEVTVPTNPTEKAFIPGATSTWRDMKTYQKYGYAVHDRFSGSSDGILVVDLSTLDQPNPTYWNRIPTITYQGQPLIYQRAHNIYIDENGFLYLFGANIGEGGALIFDLNPDPTNPTYVGLFDQYYLHDGVVRGDTLWGAAVTSGFFSAINVNNKTNPTELARQNTPSGVSHNIWFSDDNQRVFTTDETRAAFIAEYDVTNLSNITEIDRIKSSLSANAVPHNAHFINNFLVNSYYTSGLQIVDVSQPGIMVETAYYDTSPISGNGFSGAWGAYPYLPSGNILVTDREEGLFIVSSTYPRATYLEAQVVNSVNNKGLATARVQLLNANIDATTSIFGLVREGQTQAGTFDAVVSKTRFRTDTFSITLMAGTLTQVQFPLDPVGLSLPQMPKILQAASLYPNPVSTGPITLNLGKAQDESLFYQVINLQGAVLKKGTLNALQPQHSINLSLPSGYYSFELQNQLGQNRIFKLIIL